MLHPLVAVVLLIAVAMILFSRRQYTLVAFLSAAILVPNDQVLVVGALHFPALRVMAMFGLIRVMRARFTTASSKVLGGGSNRIDSILLLLTVLAIINCILLWSQLAPLITQVGDAITVLGSYFLLRFLVRDQDDVALAIRTLACIAAIVAGIMVIEQATGWNPYALLGGARSSVYASVMARDDRFRAMGSFAHPILAGTFGAVILPLFVALWMRSSKHRRFAILGMVAATIMTLASNSSTPVLGYVAGLLALAMWPLRRYMRILRWGIVITIVGLHLVMKAPVWHLISRIDVSGGSSSYHRFMLVDGFIRHFSDWWLVGTNANADWGWCMWDAANQYVAIGENSGLLPFLLFLALIVYGFKYLGRARRRPQAAKHDQLFLWALGAALFAQVVAFFGISYFDQTVVLWYGLLAMIAASSAVRRSQPVLAPRSEVLTEPLPSMLFPEDQPISI